MGASFEIYAFHGVITYLDVQVGCAFKLYKLH